MLDFIEERRGQWSVNVDFCVPAMNSLKVLRLPDGRFCIPLLTFSKDFLPPAHITIEDERHHRVSLASSERARRVAFAIALAAAQHAGLQVAACRTILWDLTDADTVVSAKAWMDLQTELSRHRTTNDARRDDLVLLARLLARSVFLLLEFEVRQIGQRKLIKFSHDGPIRITRKWLEVLGLLPRVICTRAAFGGNAESYHVQILPPEHVTVVDSYLLYSYFDVCKDRGGNSRERKDQELTTSDQLARETSLTKTLGEDSFSQWWGYIEGPAEPMSAHIRTSARRMPRLELGRDCFALFRFYPQFAGLLSLILVAAIVNIAFSIAYVVGIKDRTLNGLAAGHPEAIFIIVGIVAGLAVTLTVYPKEHLLTSSVLRPWRRLEALLAGFTIAIPVTSEWSWQSDRSLSSNVIDGRILVYELAADFLVFVSLVVISFTPWHSETTGGRMWRRKGLPQRRRQFPREPWHLKGGRVLDDFEIAARRREPGGYEWSLEFGKRMDRKTARVKKWADQYLREVPRARLFNMGIPPAVRHERSHRFGQ